MTDFALEKSIEEQNPDARICGIDEVGRGPLAGPVVAACVYIPESIRDFEFIGEICDSKKLSEPKLKTLDALIRQHCVWAIASVSPQEIDEVNILQAALKAMREAFASISSRAKSGDLGMSSDLSTPAEQGSALGRDDTMTEWHALVDGNRDPGLPCETSLIKKGDNLSTSIAAASIIAKVARDEVMHKLAIEHPHYGWERNVGYPTKEHLAAIEEHGITVHHRKSFKPVRASIERTQNPESERLSA